MQIEWRVKDSERLLSLPKVTEYLICLDPGKMGDPSAVQVYRATAKRQLPVAYFKDRETVRFVDTLVMQYKYDKVRYTELARRIAGLLGRPAIDHRYHLAFDCTGVGQAVKDELWEMGIRQMTPICYTSGGRARAVYRQPDGKFRGWRGEDDFRQLDQMDVPKNDMVDAARIALEHQEVEIAPPYQGREVPYLSEFRAQLEEFTGVMNKKGYVSYNNSSPDIHDDFVNCLMMRSWWRHEFEGRLMREQTEPSSGNEVADFMGRDLNDF